ncbi:hypothetical protein [Streptomyces virginiae]|uniref:hypothetical protein n=1 Tax=Streptomyces virginiae TaxID=1961 RepID=UPI0022521400|nr:hypothetical protein [Streptomyces virginiae]MCX4721380.1 hypothetical protein [Streptomyces virginiae]MCX5275891.1 hypothetical protein [Streptomyces virginiae]
MASAISPTGAVLAGRHGAGTLSLAAADPAGHAALATNWTAHERACADVGRDADRTGMCLAYPPEGFGATSERLVDGRIDPAALVTGEAGLGGLDAAFASLRRPEEHIEVLIRPGLAGAGVSAV